MKSLTVHGLPLFVACALLYGCIEELPEAWEIEDTRIIGVRVDVPGDPGRAWVKPGETADVSLLVVNPDLSHTDDELRLMMIACTPLPVGIGPPLCMELLQLTESFAGSGMDAVDPEAMASLGRLTCEQIEALGAPVSGLLSALGVEVLCIEGAPRFELTVPEEVNAGERLVRGVLCEKGEPFLDPSSQALFGCDLQESGEEIPFALTVPIQTGDETNHHPSFTDAIIKVDGTDWPTATREELSRYRLSGQDGSPSFDCGGAADDGLVIVVHKGTRTLRVEVTAADFEPYLEDGEQKREELRFAVYSTEGKLQRGRSVLRADDDPPGFDLEWETPKKVGPEGLLGRFFFAVRDQRGGFDSTERALCVTPPEEE